MPNGDGTGPYGRGPEGFRRYGCKGYRRVFPMRRMQSEEIEMSEDEQKSALSNRLKMLEQEISKIKSLLEKQDK